MPETNNRPKDKSTTDTQPKRTSISHEEALKHQFVPSDFVHLHNHTAYSVLDGLTRLDDLVNQTAEFGMEAVAVTDHGTIGGTFSFYKKANARGIKPILGIETYMAARRLTDRDPAHDKQRFHLTLLAMNNTGWSNLIKLSSIANLDGMYYKPRLDRETLKEYSEGIIAMSGCASSEISVALKNGQIETARDIAKWYKEVFGDRYYLELQDHGHPKSNTHWDVQAKINKGLRQLSEELDIPLVITCDGHYLKHEDQIVHEILLCVGTGSLLEDKDRMSLADFELHLMDPREIIDHWADDCPEAILNTKLVAERCNIDIETGHNLIPKFPSLPEGKTEHQYLHDLVYQGAINRYNGMPIEEARKLTPEQIAPQLAQEVADRIKMELDVIGSMGFEGYFLIVQDFINWGKNQGYVFGPGRGSAAGAIVAYTLRITDLDPLKYNLLFERFLNPDRISMPDIDVDMQDTCRDKVIEYCADKYGHDHVCNIVTFGTMASRSAVRDVARVLNIPYAESDRLSKLVPDKAKSLSQALEIDPDMKHDYETNPTAKKVYDLAIRIEGTIRSHGVHACGTVIAPKPLTDIVPLEIAQKGVIITQFQQTELEELGLLKMDFLGLSNLTIIDNCLRIIRKVYGKTIDLGNLTLDNDEAFELLRRGDTTGVFQLESAGMKRILRELKPSRFDDIIAIVALYRPGPMQFINSFIKRKHGEETITYPHPTMEPFLKETYGILVYQEQFMLISKACCGFTGGEADTLRKAVAKKKKKILDTMKTRFIEGGIKTVGAKREVMETFWNQLEDFAEYCFNKSHAACYALIAYWTAYLKANFPDAFMAALMTADAKDIDRLTIDISECNRQNITVTRPDANESFQEFAVVPRARKIRFGLSAIKSVGTKAVDDIVESRKKDGNFKSIIDFVERIGNHNCNRRTYEALIKAGTFDCFITEQPDANGYCGTRSDLLFNLDKLLEYAQKRQKEAESGQVNFLDIMGGTKSDKPNIVLDPSPNQATEKELLKWERELMGLYISAHPLDHYQQLLVEKAHPIASLTIDLHNAMVTVGGLVSQFKTLVTKSGQKMAFISIEDKTGEIEGVIFPRALESMPELTDPNSVVLVSGRLNSLDKEGNQQTAPSLMVDSIHIVSDEELNSFKPTGQPLPPPKIVSSRVRGGGRRSVSIREDITDNRMANSSAGASLKEYKVVGDSKIVYVNYAPIESDEKIAQVMALMNKYPGEDRLYIVLRERGVKHVVRVGSDVEACDDFIVKLKEIAGEDQVIVK